MGEKRFVILLPLFDAFIDMKLEASSPAWNKIKWSIFNNESLWRRKSCWSFLLSLHLLRDMPLRCKLMENSINLNNWEES